MSATSSPRNGITGHAPMARNSTPATKLIPAITPMTTRKPVLLNERWGVSSAENSVGSATSGASGALLSSISRLYRHHGAQGDPGGQKEIAKIRQAEAVVHGRGRGSVSPLQEGEPGTDHGTQLDQPLHAAGRGCALRTGDR